MLVDHHLLEKYWAGLCNPEERKAVELWMAEGIPEQPYELLAPEAEPDMKSELWNRIAEARQEETEIPEATKILSLSIGFKRIAIAAILILTIGLGIYVVHHQTPDIDLITYQEVDLPYGKKANITLPDGTQVHLNAGSRLKYPKKFSATERRIFLEGEAFFEVTKNPEKPFYVQTTHTTTRVLGTRFNLQSWKGRAAILNVEEGRVQFTASGCPDTLILRANMQGLFNGHSLLKTMVNSENKVAWTKGIMLFNGSTLREVAAELERWYAVKIRMSDPELGNYSVKARFDNPTLIDVLNDISFALNIKYKIKDKEVILSR